MRTSRKIKYSSTRSLIIDDICTATGLSLRNLAAFIDADQSLLSKLRRAKRELPTDAAIKAANLYTILYNLPVLPNKPPLSQQEIKSLQEEAAWCRVQCIPLQKRLAQIQVYEKQAAILIQLLNTMPLYPDMPERKKRWIDEQHYQATRRLEKYGWQKQHALWLQISLLQHQAFLLEEACK